MQIVQRLPRWLQHAVGAWCPPKPASKAFYLSFDDGPAGKVTERLLDLLAAYGYRATFFWLWSRFHLPTTLRLLDGLHKGGHTLALHGAEHISPWRLSASQVRDGLLRVHSLWEAAGVLAPLPFYRPPYGHIRWWGSLSDKSLGLPVRTVLWDLMVSDYKPGRAWAEALLAALRPGDVVVLHEKPWNEAQWKIFFSGAAALGWQALSLPRALEAEKAACSQSAMALPSAEG